MLEHTQRGHVAGAFRYVELEYREFSETSRSLYQDPGHYKCSLIGSIEVSMRTGRMLLVVWYDEISRQVFFWEGYSEETDKLRLKRTNYEYSDYGAPLYKVESHSIFQFCYYILGFGMKIESDYDKDLRVTLAKRVSERFGHTFR